MNGGGVKILGQKMVTYIAHKVVIKITFLIVEDVVNPIIGLDALRQNKVQFHMFQGGNAGQGQRAVLHYFSDHYYSSGLVVQGFVKGSIHQWEVPVYTVFDSQSTNQIIAEIDFAVNSKARLKQFIRRRRCFKSGS